MTRQTNARQQRKVHIISDPKDPTLIQKVFITKKPRSPISRIARELKCGVRTFTIHVSEGQLINEKKMCKRLLKEANNYSWQK